VKLENMDNGSYVQKLLTEVAANIAPDVAMMGFEKFQPFAKRRVLLPLDDYAAGADGVDLKQFYPQIIDVHRFDGALYVLPRDIAPMGLIFYNKKLFQEAGIPYPDGTWTWDYQERPELREKDFLWVIHKLTKFAPGGSVTQWGFASGWPTLLAQSFALSVGGREFDDYKNPTKVTYNSPEMVKAYSLEYNLMFDKKWVPSKSEIDTVLQSNCDALFTSQKLAMVESGIWEVPNIRRSLVPGQAGFFDWDVALFPAYKDGTLRFPSGGSGYCIFKSTPHPKEAWKLVKFMASPEVDQMVAAAGLAQPAIRSLALSAPWIPDASTSPEMRYPPSRIVTDHAVSHVLFAPSSEYYPDLQTYINPVLDKLWSGEESPKDALDEVNQQAQLRLDTLRKHEDLPSFNWAYGIGLGALLALILGFWIYWPERGARLSNRQRAENRSAYKFIAPWIIGFVVFMLGPMILSLLMSVTDWDIISPAKYRGFENFSEALFQDPRFWVSLRVTFVYTVFAVPLGICGSLFLALLLNQKVKGMPLFRTMYYLPSLASLVAASLIWKKVFQPDGGLVNRVIYGADGHGNFLGLAHFLTPFSEHGQPVNWLGSEKTALLSLIIMSVWGIGGGMVILLAGLQGIPDYYYEAAKLDGANAWKQFRAVTMPLLTPALFFVLVTGIIGSFQTFTQSFVMTAGGPGDATRFFMLHLYVQAFTALRMGYASALAWLLFVVILVFTFLQFRMSKWVYSEN
jgi:multiple sugar transport system permease protein